MVTKAKGKAKPKPLGRPEGTTPLNLNLPTDLLANLDTWVETLNNGTRAGPPWTRTDLVRAIFIRALDERGAKGETP